MKLPPTLNKEIVEFLSSLPNISDPSMRRTLIENAGLDQQLQTQIRFAEPPASFSQMLVSTLIQYGKLEDGRYALEAILESAKNYVGEDKKTYCDTLIQQFQAVSSSNDKTLIKSTKEHELKKKGSLPPPNLSEPPRPNEKDDLIRFAIVFMCLTILFVIFRNWILGPSVWSILLQIIRQWLWTIVFLIMLGFIASFVGIWIWNPEIFSSFPRYDPKELPVFFLRIILSLSIQIVLILGFIIAFFHHTFPTQEADILFPQAAKLGPVLIRTYRTNAEIYPSFHKETPLFGPEGYVKITLKTYGHTEGYNCGWVLFLLRGLDISNFNQFRFLIRGERGGEKIGVKAKDAVGQEIALMLDEHYLPEGNISTNWQEANIPLEDFGNVNFSLIDNFSLYTNGEMAGTRYQTIYVGKFQLR